MTQPQIHFHILAKDGKWSRLAIKIQCGDVARDRISGCCKQFEENNFQIKKMEEEYEIGVNDIRELNQMSLGTFTFDKENMFESSADLVIKKLIQEKLDAEKEYYEWIRIKKNEPTRFAELEEQADRADINLEMQIHEYHIDNYYREEEIWALFEMKIIYLYKFFEINVKKLLKGSFPNSSTKEFFRWESLIQFLKDKNINPIEIIGYKEIYQLKELNNSFKHTDSLEKQTIELIPEFKSVKQISYRQLDKFYKRLRKFPVEFLKDLASKIYDELYKFDEEKIERMSNRIALRMEKKDALILIEKIKTAYNTVYSK